MIVYSSKHGWWFFVCNEDSCAKTVDDFDTEREAEEAYRLHLKLSHR